MSRDDTDPERPDRDALRQLHGHLGATAELPVERDASRWLGEAEAVAGDALAMVESDAPASAVATRVEQVADLLAAVDSTGHPEADDHLDAARQLADRLQNDTE